MRAGRSGRRAASAVDPGYGRSERRFPGSPVAATARSSCPGSSRIKPARGRPVARFWDRSASHYVCFRRFGNLVAADPRNGKTLWIRRDLPQGCVVFGDDRYVFVLQPHRDEAMVLRASDGELVGMRKMPPIADKRASDSCLAILGRKILLWQPQQDRRVLSLFDPLEGRQEWPERKFAAGARVSLIGEKAVGVMEPGGRFVLYSLPDGRTIADLKLEARAVARAILPCSSPAASTSC